VSSERGAGKGGTPWRRVWCHAERGNDVTGRGVWRYGEGM